MVPLLGRCGDQAEITPGERVWNTIYFHNLELQLGSSANHPPYLLVWKSR